MPQTNATPEAPEHLDDQASSRPSSPCETAYQSSAQASTSIASPSDWQTQEYNMAIFFGSDIENAIYDKNEWQPRSNSLDWQARLEITAKDIPSLMKHGFYCGEANVQPKKGYMLFQEELRELRDDVTKSDDWVYGRCYSLRDLGHDPQWVASLWVYAHEISELAQFRVKQLAREDIFSAWALDSEGRTLYNFDYNCPDDSINVIYDDMPMEGLWPWPRKAEGSSCSMSKEQLELIQHAVCSKEQQILHHFKSTGS